MFGFPGDKQHPHIKDLVWMHHKAKLAGSLKLLDQYPDAVLSAWFSDTLHEFTQYFSKENKIHVQIRTSRTIPSSFVEDKIVIMLEHYPLRKKEEELFKYWRPKEIFVLSALDEPLFRQFNGEGIIKLMEGSGMKEDEFIEHSLISKSIERLQESVEKKILFDNQANSAEDWFRKNVQG